MNEIIETCKRSPLARERNIKRLRKNLSAISVRMNDLEDENCTVAREHVAEFMRLDTMFIEFSTLLQILENMKNETR